MLSVVLQRRQRLHSDDLEIQSSDLLLTCAREVVSISHAEWIMNSDGRLMSLCCRVLGQALQVLIEQSPNQRYSSEIRELCTTLTAMSQRSPYVNIILTSLRKDLHVQRLELPSVVEKLLDQSIDPTPYFGLDEDRSNTSSDRVTSGHDDRRGQ